MTLVGLVSYWHCWHSLRSRVYETVRCLSVYLSVCLSAWARCCCRMLLWARRPDDIDCCTSGAQHQRRANAGSVTLSAYAGS